VKPLDPSACRFDNGVQHCCGDEFPFTEKRCAIKRCILVTPHFSEIDLRSALLLTLLANLVLARSAPAQPPPPVGDPFQWQPTYNAGCWVAGDGPGVKQCERAWDYYLQYYGTLSNCTGLCELRNNVVECENIPNNVTFSPGPDHLTETPSVRPSGSAAGDGPGNQARWRMLKCVSRKKCFCIHIIAEARVECRRDLQVAETFESQHTSYHFDLGGPAVTAQ
jgi:hypothetical protein